jgi:excisionase family DNA binding protein
MLFDQDYPILLSPQQASRKIGKSEKTIYRWIQSGKLPAEKHGGGGYLIKREDLAAVDPHVTKEWHEKSRLADLELRVLILEGQNEELRGAFRAQQRDIEELQYQLEKLKPKKAPAKRKTSTTRARPTTRRKKIEDDW